MSRKHKSKAGYKSFQNTKTGTSPKLERAQSEQCYVVAKKIMLHYDLEPELVDVFTKRQKQSLFYFCYDQPDVKAKKERTVPRQYVRNINNATYQFLKTTYWGNPEHDITLMELATYGLSFLGNLSDMLGKDGFIPGTSQADAAQRIFEKFDEDYVLQTAFKEALENVWHETRRYSKVNFRMYGYEYDCITKEIYGGCRRNKLIIRLTAQDCEEKVFIYKNIKRKAYRLFMTAAGLRKPEAATVPRNQIFPDAQEDEKLNIYIQSHALQRFKMRMDVFSPADQNLMIQYAFSDGLQLTPFENGFLFACMIDEKLATGYFTFFVDNNDIVINTFIPIVSANTPEGKKLHEIHSLDHEEIVFLGMDKLSFLLKVDFEQIPKLKNALIHSTIWELKTAIDDMESEDKEQKSMIDLDKTKFVKGYFDKLKRKPKVKKL